MSVDADFILHEYAKMHAAEADRDLVTAMAYAAMDARAGAVGPDEFLYRHPHLAEVMVLDMVAALPVARRG